MDTLIVAKERVLFFFENNIFTEYIFCVVHSGIQTKISSLLLIKTLKFDCYTQI
jgi:hypothetical protein